MIKKTLLGFFACLSLLGSLIMFSGCSVKSAMEQPDKKDVSFFERGTPRYEVIGEIGQPVNSVKSEEGNFIDTYSFIQGYSKGVKAARALGHGVLDFFTLGLWEIIGSPIEAVASGDRVVVRVRYDKYKLVDKVQIIKGKGELKLSN